MRRTHPLVFYLKSFVGSSSCRMQFGVDIVVASVAAIKTEEVPIKNSNDNYTIVGGVAVLGSQ